MQVKDLILYQVATDKNYKVGEKYSFGDSPNGQWERVYNINFRKNDCSLYYLGFKYADGKNIFKNKGLMIDICKAMTEYDFIIRELAVEEVRKEKYPQYPSRFKCLFLSESKEVVVENLSKIAKSRQGKQFQAVAVKLNGNLFYARNVALPRKGLSYNEYKVHAEKYWGQEQNSTDEIKEILFEGSAEIVKIIDEVTIK